MSVVEEVETLLLAAWPLARWRDESVLVAVSGGADSMALWRALLRTRGAARGRLAAAHFNHRWRAAEAEEDQAFVVEQGRLLDCQVHCGRAVDAPATNTPERSEAAARQARYAFLKQTAESLGVRYVATAHSADDQAETVLHRVLRGTGLRGLAGMPRVRSLTAAVSLVRPLLAVRRATLRAYLQELGQAFRDDSSNRDLRYTRNRLRQVLLPRLEAEYNPAVTQALCRLGQLAGEAQAVFTEWVQDLAERCVRRGPPGSGWLQVDCVPLQSTAPYLRRELFVSLWQQMDWPLQPMGLAEWDRLAELVIGHDTSFDLPGPVHVQKTQGKMQLSQQTR